MLSRWFALWLRSRSRLHSTPPARPHLPVCSRLTFPFVIHLFVCVTCRSGIHHHNPQTRSIEPVMMFHCTQPTTPYVCAFDTECQKWCLTHVKDWPVKCTWPGQCDGCPACSGACLVRGVSDYSREWRARTQIGMKRDLRDG